MKRLLVLAAILACAAGCDGPACTAAHIETQPAVQLVCPSFWTSQPTACALPSRRVEICDAWDGMPSPTPGLTFWASQSLTLTDPAADQVLTIPRQPDMTLETDADGNLRWRCDP